jgi:wobble nucleotide-excising tRNase
LNEHRDDFIQPVEKGQPDDTKWRLANAMLSYINTNSSDFVDGLNYVDGCVETEVYRSVFKLIFDALGQEQHYKMMMGEEESK